jgi:ATP adenylyltransferase
MDRLWAPWRINYIKNSKKGKICIFCKALKNSRASFVVLKTKYSIAMLNIFPYNNGHILVSPRRHIAKLSQLRKSEITDLFQTLNKSIGLLDKVLKPDGYNIGINLSRSAGAGITKHLHIHIVPRWIGDTNFMPAIYGAKIISQSLSQLYRQLKNAESK